MIYLLLFWEYFKVGLFAIGGGMATIPFLYRLSETSGWYTTSQLADMIAVSESTPGPIGVNMATYVGYVTAGIPGSVVACLGLITPSIIIILLIARVLKAFRENKYVDAAFYGIRPASTGLIAASAISVALISLFNQSAAELSSAFRPREIILAAIIFLLSNFIPKTKKLHPIIFIALSAAVGIALGL